MGREGEDGRMRMLSGRESKISPIFAIVEEILRD